MLDVAGHTDPNAVRKSWMGVLARAEIEELERMVEALTPAPRHSLLRSPETGLVMVQARANGTGQKFNAGEMTVTRCSVRLASGTVGHAYVAGRSGRHAELAAILDAVLQDADDIDQMRADLIAPLEQTQANRRADTARKTAATKVDFFTMVRGED